MWNNWSTHTKQNRRLLPHWCNKTCLHHQALQSLKQRALCTLWKFCYNLLRKLRLHNMTGHIMQEVPVLFCPGITTQSRESSKTVGLQEKHHKLCTHLLGFGWKCPIFHQWINFNTEPAQCTTLVRKLAVNGVIWLLLVLLFYYLH